MKNKFVITTMFLGIILYVFPEQLSAVQTQSNQFAAQDINEHANAISHFLFGPVAKFVAILGAAYGLFLSFTTFSFKPFLTFIAIGLGVVLLPKFINSVFTVLLP